MWAALLLSLFLLDHVSAGARTTRLHFSTTNMTPKTRFATWKSATPAQARGFDVGADDEQHDGRIKRITDYVRGFTILNGASMVMNDEDIQCIMTLRTLLQKRRGEDGAAHPNPVATLFNLIVKTTPLCKVRLLAKSRMFLKADFVKNLLDILFNKDLKKDAEGSDEEQDPL